MRNQVTCKCSAYDFPHRFGGGKCNGLVIVIQAVGSDWCRHCLLNNHGCEVLRGQENPRECPAVQDFAEYHEVKI